MNGIFMLHRNEVEQILRIAIDERVFAIMSYMSMDKWNVTKVRIADLSADKLSVEKFDSRTRPRLADIKVNQPVGVSFKHAYGKFVFDTTVVALKPSGGLNCGESDTIVLAAPDRIEVVQRRSYFRVNVPHFLNVAVMLWHLSKKGDPSLIGERRKDSDAVSEPRKYYRGVLIDISAGGAQVMLPEQNRASKDFKKGQYIGLRFTPMPYEMPLMFNANIRNILPSEDHKSIYLGLQIVGLEASPEGRQVLYRIAEVTKRYYQLNLSDAKQMDMQSDIHFHRSYSDAQQMSSRL
jgi:hypothetical protein